MDKLISIIVPIYKVELYLERCLNSITKQTYKNIEIILVDDGSPDNCPAMCDDWAKKNNRIRVIHKVNGGLSDARNAGLDIAKGEYVLFVDPDDYVDLDMCEKLSSYIDKDIDIVAFGFRRVYDDHEDPHIDLYDFKKFNNKEAFSSYIQRQDFTHMVCDKMFRLKLFDGLRFIKGRFAEDLAICYQLFGKAQCAVSIKRTFYSYYTRSDSIMGLGSEKLCCDVYKGEYEAYKYGNKNYPELRQVNNTRFFNQSMKIYLKLIKLYKKSKDDVMVQLVKNNMEAIKNNTLPVKTKIFYFVFKLNKSLAWQAFRTLKLS